MTDKELLVLAEQVEAHLALAEHTKTDSSLAVKKVRPLVIEIVGDLDAARENWHFEGPFKKMTFAAKMQHLIYWGPLKKPVEWSLKTVLAPWSYLASVLYHDSFWYSFKAKRVMNRIADSDWARLFQNWEKLSPDEKGFPEVGDEPLDIQRCGITAAAKSLRILGTCLKEAPEFHRHAR